MAKPTLLERLTGGAPRIDWDKLNRTLADAQADYDRLNRDQGRLAFLASNGEAGAGEALKEGGRKLQEARGRLDQAELAIQGAHDAEAEHRDADAKREQEAADKLARAKLDRLTKAGEKVGASAAAYVKDAAELREAWNDVQSDFSTNPHLRESVRGAHPPREIIAVELTRLANVPHTRPDMLPPGANGHTLPFAYQRDPIAKVYGDLARTAWKARQ